VYKHLLKDEGLCKLQTEGIWDVFLSFSEYTTLEAKESPVGKIAEKAVRRSVLLTIWHWILSAELTKRHSFRLSFWRFCPVEDG